MTQELARRIAFTIGALFLFRLGTYIPLPGIDPETWESLFGTQSRGGILGMLNMTAGTGIRRVSILALGINSYVVAAVNIRLLSLVWRGLDSIERSGEAGRRRIARYTLILTLLIAGFEAYDYAVGIQGLRNVVSDPGWFFLLSTAITLTGGVFFLVWLSQQITRHGIGNGLALILISSIVAELPRDLATMLELGRQGAMPANLTLTVVLAVVAVTALVVFMESARRDIRVEYAERKVGERMLPARSSALSIKINSAGVLMPTMMMAWIYWLLEWVGYFFADSQPWLRAAIADHYVVLQTFPVFVFCFVYAAYVIDPDRAAESLHKLGGVIPGIEPGESTASYLDRVVSSMMVIGAVYLTAVWLFPVILRAFPVSFYFSGMTTMLVVCVVLDIRTQVRDLSCANAGGKYL